MRKSLLYGVLMLYLFQITELHELYKLPALVQHYYEHKEDNARLSLLDFLAMHYPGDQDHDSSDDQDEKQLPFKSHEHQSLNVVWHLPNDWELPRFMVRNYANESMGFEVPARISTVCLNAIWQPPRQV